MNIYKNGILKYKFDFNFRNFLIRNLRVDNLLMVPVPKCESKKYFENEFLSLIFIDDQNIFMSISNKYPNVIDLKQLIEILKIGIVPNNIFEAEITDKEYYDLYVASVEVLMQNKNWK